MCFHAEIGIKGIGRVRWQAAFLGFYSVPSPQSSVLLTARVVEWKMFVVLILTQPGYDGGKSKIPKMFPGCFHGKEKD